MQETESQSKPLQLSFLLYHTLTMFQVPLSSPNHIVSTMSNSYSQQPFLSLHNHINEEYH